MVTQDYKFGLCR